MKEFEKWFRKAENDLLAITNNLSANEVPADVCCFHAQQAAEKYLKAYLVAHQIEFPKTHDLIEFMNLCTSRNNKFFELKPTCAKLKNYGIAPRYPDDVNELTIEDAKIAYNNSLSIKDFILNYFFE